MMNAMTRNYLPVPKETRAVSPSILQPTYEHFQATEKRRELWTCALDLDSTGHK